MRRRVRSGGGEDSATVMKLDQPDDDHDPIVHKTCVD